MVYIHITDVLIIVNYSLLIAFHIQALHQIMDCVIINITVEEENSLIMEEEHLLARSIMFERVRTMLVVLYLNRIKNIRRMI